MSIEIVCADQLHQLDQHADPATRYVASLVRRGPSSYLDNANVRMEALMIDGRVLPLVINDCIAGNSNVYSAYAHYSQYAAHEFARRFGRVSLAMTKAPRALLGMLLRHGSIDRIVFVNNWLLTTNPSHRLSSPQIARLTAWLTRRYPDAAIVFRSVNELSDHAGFDALRTNHYRMVPSRQVYMVDTASGRYLEHDNVHTDLAMLKKTPYSIIDGTWDLTPHSARFAQLYRALYLDKHHPLNPAYNVDFFTLVLGGKFLEHHAFTIDGRVDAFVSFFSEDRVMTASLIGYDLALPIKLGLLRMGFARMISEAAKRKMLLNLSAGVGEFKMLRGAVRVQEYDAVYDAHLSMSRRLSWACLRAIGQVGRRLSPRSSISLATRN